MGVSLLVLLSLSMYDEAGSRKHWKPKPTAAPKVTLTARVKNRCTDDIVSSRKQKKEQIPGPSSRFPPCLLFIPYL